MSYSHGLLPSEVSRGRSPVVRLTETPANHCLVTARAERAGSGTLLQVTLSGVKTRASSPSRGPLDPVHDTRRALPQQLARC